MKKTKIVATIGPASNNEETLREMIDAGMNVVRLNLSHGSRDSHRELTKLVRGIADSLDTAIAIMADTPGPAVRIERLINEKVYLKAGQDLIITEEDVMGDENQISIDHEGCIECLKPGMSLLLANGEIGLRVKEVDPPRAICEVLNSAELGERKRISFPDCDIPVSLHDDDNIEFAGELDVDYFAASFVQNANDVDKIKARLKEQKIGVIAKIETKNSVDNIDEIVDAADGIMVARGDLGVEIPFELVPRIQKSIVQKCNRQGKPVIIATQMLKSMTEAPTPTRAEVADVANAILDGTDAIMLSEESAIGGYPVDSVRVMASVAHQMEQEPEVYHRFYGEDVELTEAIGESACQVAERINAAAIIPSTSSGSTASLVSKFRPTIPIVAVTYFEKARNRMALVWGVIPLCIEFENNTSLMLERSIEATTKAMNLPSDSTVVITAGVPFGVVGTTNLIKVEQV
jgi:pyruvate kinase